MTAPTGGAWSVNSLGARHGRSVTTVDRGFLPVSSGPGGYRVLQESSGEPYRAHPQAVSGGGIAGRAVLVFAQLSDTHVMDSQSPARVELLDRYADPDYRPDGEDRTVGTYRPQELFTAHVVEAMVRAVNEHSVGRSPVPESISPSSLAI